VRTKNIEEQTRSVPLTHLQRMLLVRAANTEMNFLRRLYADATPDGKLPANFQAQYDALAEAKEMLDFVGE